MSLSAHGGSEGQASACNAGDPGSISGSGRSPGEGNGNPVFLPGEFFPGQMNLAGYRPWGCKELDTTEQVTPHLLTTGTFCMVVEVASQSVLCQDFREIRVLLIDTL